jgi:hypothetical protein
MVFVASDQPIDLLESGPRALAAAPESFGIHGIHRVEDFYASWTLDSDGVRKLAEGRPVNTDDHNRLATTRLPAADRHMNRDIFDASLAVVDALTPRAPRRGRRRRGDPTHELERRAQARAQAGADVAAAGADGRGSLAHARRRPPRPVPRRCSDARSPRIRRRRRPGPA